jgi:glycosyltransferase involved in cell wall biosynthesis
LKILIVASVWPSKDHPYLIYLFKELKNKFPQLTLFLFQKVNEIHFAELLVGKENVEQVLENAQYRFVFSRNPFRYFLPILRIISHPVSSRRIFTTCLTDGYSKVQALGQLIYSNQLIGEEYDLIYLNSLQTGRHFCIRALFPRAKIIASSRGQDFDWKPSGYDKVLRDVDHLHVLGTHLKSMAEGRGFPSSRISMIPPAVMPQEIQTREQNKSDEIVIMSSARIVWSKGYTYSLRAISLLSKMLKMMPFKYVILGDGEDMDLIKFEINRLGLSNRVELMGWVNQIEVNRWLAKSHIYLLLSIEEGFNNSVMQAQSLGLPCVVSDAGGLPENVKDGETGIIVPRYDAQKAADALYSLVTDNVKRSRMGQAAGNRMRSEFSISNQSAKYEEMFRTITFRDK